MPGVDGERGEDRKDPSLELFDHVDPVIFVELVPAREADAHLGQRRREVVEEEVFQPIGDLIDPFGHRRQLLRRGEAVRAEAVIPPRPGP